MEKFEGQQFGRLFVLEEVERNHPRIRRMKCICSCGTETVTSLARLRSGKTQSCGCLRSELSSKKATKHGYSSHPLYGIHNSMIQRCTNRNQPSYKNYGGRGVSVCEEWMNRETFIKWAFENGYRKELTIERVDNNKGYCPENCYFADKTIQANNKTNSRNITFRGRTMTIAQWSKETGIKYATLYHRLKAGWEIDKLFDLNLHKGGSPYHQEKG